jgi:hypothetical protein
MRQLGRDGARPSTARNFDDFSRNGEVLDLPDKASRRAHLKFCRASRKAGLSPQFAQGWVSRRCSHTLWRRRETPLFADKERGIPAYNLSLRRRHAACLATLPLLMRQSNMDRIFPIRFFSH